MKEKSIFEGIIVAAITPFKKNGSIDKEGFRKNLHFLVKHDINGVLINGTAGEFFKLNLKERQLLVEIASEEIKNRVNIYVGTGANSTQEAIKLAKHAEKCKANGILVLSPYFIPPSYKELENYYKIISENVDIPIALYNIPSKTGVNLMSIINNLILNANIIAIKETTNDLTEMVDIIRITQGKVKVLIGHDLLVLPALIMGAHGAITSMSNLLTKKFSELYNYWQIGNISSAKTIQDELYYFRSLYKYGTFPNILKAAMNIAGLCGGYLRGPSMTLSKDLKKELTIILNNLKLI